MSGPDDLGALLVRLRDESGWLGVTLLAGGRDEPAAREMGALLDRARRDALRAVVDASGWPDEEAAGRAGSRAALDLLVSAEPDGDLLGRCLRLAAEAAAAGRLPRWHVACIEDHIALLESGRQRYGTRLALGDAGWEPLPVAHPGAVENLRRGVGLPPLADVLAAVNPSDPPVG